MNIQLSDHFTYKRLLLFVYPSIIMMIFTSIYGIVDGIFISNFVGSVAFAGVNFILPFVFILGGFGFIAGTGGSALVAKVLGEDKKKLANEIFSQLVYITILVGVALAILGEILLRPVAVGLGAEGEMLSYCIAYGRIAFLSLPAFILQTMFQTLMVTAERPKLGLFVTVLSGITNMVMDLVLVGLLHGGVQGAAFATFLSEYVGGLIPLFYFFSKNNSLLRLGRFSRDLRYLVKVLGNGISEFMSNISMSVVNMVYNVQLLRYFGTNGVSAYGVIMYVNFVFAAVYIGYSMGSAPIISYHYGAGNTTELKNLFHKSMRLIAMIALVLTVAAELTAPALSAIFVSYDADLLRLTILAFRIYALCYIFNGFNIYGSSLFTALNNGKISAVISFFRLFVFQIVCILLLPVLLGRNGIWGAIVVAEVLALVMTVWFLVRNRGKYQYV